jgi:prefoldin subunit 5
MADLQVILNAIEDMNKSHHMCIDALKEEIAIIQRGSKIHLSAEMEVVNRRISELDTKVDSLDTKVSTQNGNVAALKAESIKRQEVINDFRTLEKNLNGLKKRLKERWLLLLLGGIFFVVIVILIYDIGGFPKMFEWLINKIVK